MSGVSATGTSKPESGPKPELRWLPVEKLTVDRSYQRTIDSARSKSLIVRIGENFRWSAFQAILAVRDGNGGYKIIDGQHRVEGAKRAGIDNVPAVVVAAGSVAEEAAAFVQANLQRVSVNPFALHRARCATNDEAALAVEKLARAAGIEIAPYPIPADKLAPGQTLALATIARLPRLYSLDVAKHALGAVAAAYGKIGGGLRASFIAGAASVISKHHITARPVIARKIAAYLRNIEPPKFYSKVIHARELHGIREIDAVARLIGIGIAENAAQGRVNAPSRERLMAGR